MKTKEIYGIYDMNENEQCVYVGELIEIFKMLGFTARTSRKFFEAIRDNILIKNRYEICYLFKEKVKNESI